MADKLPTAADLPRTPLDSSLCPTEVLITPGSASRTEMPGDIVEAWLARYSPGTGARLRAYMPAEFAWWVRTSTRQGLPAAYALSESIHETLHHATRALNLCDGGLWHYFLDGRIAILEPREHGLARYAGAAPYIETQALRQGLRFQRYMATGGLHENNTLYVLLDELNAYIAEADFLLSVLEDADQAKALQRKGLRTDAGFGGAVEFQLFAMAYLAMQCSEPAAANCRTLAQDEPLLSLLRSRFAQVEALVQRRERLSPLSQALVQMPPGVEQERRRTVWEPLKRRLAL